MSCFVGPKPPNEPPDFPAPLTPPPPGAGGCHRMPAPDGCDRRHGGVQGRSFLPIHLPPHAPTPEPGSPSSPPRPIPPLSFRHLSPCARWSAWVIAALSDPGFAPVLRSTAISDAVAASTAAVIPDRHALSALLSFWHPDSHTFRLPAGPATFSLEDALLLAGLPPSGAPLDRPLTPTEEDLRIRLVVEKEKIRELHPCARKARRVSAELWLEWFDSRIRPGEDDELRHLGFLAYWLAFFVTPRLRRKGWELPECLFALAARLYLGERIALGPAVVANLYAEMDMIVTSGVAAVASGRVDVWAPLWLLQAWIWERYDRLRPPELRAPEFPVSNVRVLFWARRRRKTTDEESLRVLQEEDCFEWRPYLHNSLNWTEPQWFSKETVLVSSRGKDKPEWLEDYLAIIRQAALTGLCGDGMYNSAMYNPHIVARQLGYDQDVPFPIVHGFDSKGIEVWIPGICRRGKASKEYVAWLNGHFVGHQDADQYGRSEIAYQENSDNSSPPNEPNRNVVDTAGDKCRESTMPDSRKCTIEDLLAQENETEVVVLDLSSSDTDCSATAVKGKIEKKKRLDKLSGNGDRNKRNKVFGGHEGLQACDDGLEGRKYCGLQKDPNSDISKRDTQLESDDECVVLESHGEKCEVINLDDDQEESILDPEDHDRQLVLELEEFVRSGLFSQWEESSDEDEEGGRKQESLKNSNNDPYAEAAMREYPVFFELIPQRPHYRELVNNDDALRDLACSGMWLLLVGLAREVLKTSCDTEALEVAYLMKKARELEQNGFNVKHLIARLKEPQTRLRRLQDSRARLEYARTKAQESEGVKSLSNHLSKLKHNILTMERHLDGNKQARSASVHNELGEGINLVSLEKEVEAAEKYCQAMKDEVAAMRLRYTDI
ncbi:unnamed protein product [Triticum turgidum subsp. durum]|uniref:Aminotransferase-like plant mobile domain-containing protein n=3 Tax=Triticum TaxID=4564 RepID=A0A9R0WZQ8_TRITD|nr:unnamed protein product [Triticum turgidum subsp. durum]